MTLLPSAAEILKVISDCEKKSPRLYASAFRQRVTMDTDGWALLANIFEFHFRPSNFVEPFGPMIVMDGKRSAIPGDIEESRLHELKALYLEVDDPEFCARVADLVWLRLRTVEDARGAVSNYLNAGREVEDVMHWPSSMERYERALRIARQIDKDGSLLNEVLSFIEERVYSINGDDPLYFSLKAMELLEEFRSGDFERLAQIAGKVVAKAESSHEYKRARSYLEVQAKLYKRANESESAEGALERYAKSFVSEAEAREKEGTFIAARSFWQEAIRAFQDRPKLRAEIPSLHIRLRNASERMKSEMKSFEFEVDLTEQVEATKKHFANLQFDDALFTFVSFVSPLSPSEFRERVEKSIQEYPLRATILTDVFDASGRKIGVRPSAMTDDKEQQEEAISGFIEEEATVERNFRVHAFIAPAFRMLVESYEFDSSILEKYLGDSKFIPVDRTQLFLDGILSGFQGNFSTALHLLVPQTENALREIIASNGVVAANVDQQGIEEAWGFERCLHHHLCMETIGEELTFELKSLLVARLGSNFRNLIAHGLVNYDQINGELAVYLWWIILRLVAFPTDGMRAYIDRRRAAAT